VNCHQNQTQENDAFAFAISLNLTKAYEATSMGLTMVVVSKENYFFYCLWYGSRKLWFICEWNRDIY